MFPFQRARCIQDLVVFAIINVVVIVFVQAFLVLALDKASLACAFSVGMFAVFCVRFYFMFLEMESFYQRQRTSRAIFRG